MQKCECPPGSGKGDRGGVRPRRRGVSASRRAWDVWSTVRRSVRSASEALWSEPLRLDREGVSVPKLWGCSWSLAAADASRVRAMALAVSSS